MTTDAWLAIAHHVTVFGTLAVLVAEWAALRPGLAAPDVIRLARIDAAYGVLAAGVIGFGIARVAAGAKPAGFYTENPTFWLKMVAFATVGGLSVRPTIRFLRWQRAVRAGGDAPLPGAEEVRSVRRSVGAELCAFATIPVLAALAARGIGA